MSFFLKILLIAIVAFSQLSQAAFYDPAFSSPWTYYNVQLITNNADAFKVKMDLIRKALPPSYDSHTGIDMVYFIWEDDKTSSLLMQELMAKADQGVKIRILVDYFETQQQVPALLTLVRHQDPHGNYNISVKRFRPPTPALVKYLREMKIDANEFLVGLMLTNKKMVMDSVKNSMIYKRLVGPQGDLKSFSQDRHDIFFVIKLVLDLIHSKLHPLLSYQLNNFLKRSHYKLLLVNKSDFVMGGRNISDQYHTPEDSPFILPLKREYAFQDTEIAATQSLTDDTLSQNFEKLWNDRAAVDLQDTRYYYNVTDSRLPAPLDMATINSRAQEARAAGYDNDQLTPSAVKISEPLTGQIFENTAASPFWSSSPYIPSSLDRDVLHREIAKEYVNLINSAQSTIDIVTAYFYIDTGFSDEDFSHIIEALKAAARRHVQVNIYTNDIRSTDLAIVNEVSFRNYDDLEKNGVHMHELDAGSGTCPWSEPSTDICPVQGSLHTKVMAIDNNYLAVGSFNLDPRSQMYDTNNIIVFRDDSGTLVNAFRAARVNGLHWHGPEHKVMEENQLPKLVTPTIFNQLRELI